MNHHHLLKPVFIPLTILSVLAIMGAIFGFLEGPEDDWDDVLSWGLGLFAGWPTGRAVPFFACARATVRGGLALTPTYASLTFFCPSFSRVYESLTLTLSRSNLRSRSSVHLSNISRQDSISWRSARGKWRVQKRCQSPPVSVMR